MKKLRLVCLWSGGKDSCLALYKIKRQGYKIISLLNFVSKDTHTSRSHGLKSELIRYQAKLMNIPLIQSEVESGKYNQTLKTVINKLKRTFKIQGIVFGDIYLAGHKEWAEEICQKLKMQQIMPLWRCKTQRLIQEFIKYGFEAIIVSIKKEIMNPAWLGCKIDENFIPKLSQLPQKIDPCGEEGEFHTLVTNGPLFKKPLQLLKTRNILRNNHWQLEILSWK
jgi:uncharacterized protein (TIGR00290 family)